MKENSRIYLAGHTGLVGSSLKNRLENLNYKNILLNDHSHLDLRRQLDVERFFEHTRPEYVFIAAARVGGIKDNIEKKAEFIYDNLQIQTNIIHSSWNSGVTKLIFLGSSCTYPKGYSQPIKEEEFLNGRLEETSDAFAVAKIAGIQMCKAYNEQYKTNFISVIPCSLYGPNDNFNQETSHFISGILSRMHQSKINSDKSFEVWGTGFQRREIMHVDDLSDALILLMNLEKSPKLINIGFGQDYEIREIVEKIKGIINFKGEVIYNTEKPAGVSRKLLDSERIKSLGWSPKISLEKGLRDTYN